MKKINTKSGFTLIELLVVIAIIGILSAVVTSSLQSGRAKARNAERLQTVDQLNKAMEIYSTTSGLNRLPAVLDLIEGGGVQGYNGSWYCLGAVDNTTCTGSTLFDTGLNAAVKSGLSGEIPQNKSMTGNASWYRYVSATPTSQNGTAAFTSPPGGNCSPTTCPPGAYIIWAMEKQGGVNCGRGVLQTLGGANAVNYTCVLRVGDRIKY